AFLLTVQNPRFTAVAFLVAGGFGANIPLVLPVLSALISACFLCALVPLTAAVLVILLWSLPGNAPLRWANPKTLAGVGLAAIVNGGAIEYAVLRAGTSRPKQIDPTTAWDQYRSSPRQELPVEAD